MVQEGREQTINILKDAQIIFFHYFDNSSIDRTVPPKMKTVNSHKKAKIFQQSLRPSQSLHTRFAKQPHFITDSPSNPHLPLLIVCIIYGKRKIQFYLKPNTTFEELERVLYSHLYTHLLQ